MKKLLDILQTDQSYVIAIDGPSGSGKTTLAKRLEKNYDVTVIHMDDYFLPEEKKTEARLSVPGSNVDLDRLKEEVFAHIDDETICSHHFNCKTQTLQTRPPLPKKQKIIIEGVYSCHPNLMPYYDVLVVCHVSRETQMSRIKKRSQPHIFKRFIEEWIPLEDDYFDAYDIYDKADIIIENE